MSYLEFGVPDSSSVFPYSLGSLRPGAGARLFVYVPKYEPIGPRKTTLGNRLQHVFALREDYSAALELRHLRPSQMSDALALTRWLIAGGAVNVVTYDTASHTYLCTLKPGTTPDIENADDNRLHFTYRVELAASAPVIVDYSV